MTNWQGNYQAGRPYAICDRCDRKKRLDELKSEWTGLKVCDQCWDPRPVHLTAPRINPAEGAAIPGARPETIQTADDEDIDIPLNDGTYASPDGVTSWSNGSSVLWSDGTSIEWSA